MYMKSVAGSDGVLQMTITFAPGTDPNKAQVDVQNRVSQALSRLPSEVSASGDHAEAVAGLPHLDHAESRTASMIRFTCATTPIFGSRISSRAFPASA